MKKRKTIFVKSVWVMLSIFFVLLFAFVAVGTSIASENSAPINSMLGIEPYEKIRLEGGAADMEYYKSDFVKKNADGSYQYFTEEDGYKHRVYDDAAMRANSERVGEQTAVEGSVLLWNDGGALPLAKDAGVSLFGVSANNYVFLGNGSGGMSLDPKDGSLSVALRGKGLAVNTTLNSEYLRLAKDYGRKLSNDGKDTNFRCWFGVGEVPYEKIEGTVNSTIAAYGDAAVMIVSRTAGEDYDISTNVKDKYVDGSSNYLELTVEEAGVLRNLNALKSSGKLKKVVLLLNTANPMQMASIRDAQYGVDACVWVGMGGTMSYPQIADVLAGHDEYVVSGHMTDTVAYNNYSAPSYANFGDFTWTEMSDGLPDLEKEYGSYYQTHNMKYMVYQEGIYVGYRYYETRYEDYVLGRGNAGSVKGATDGGAWNYAEEVAFPFGYGDSFTDFAYDAFAVKETDDAFEVSLNIKNVGDKYAGKDVLQVYLQKPYTPYDDLNGVEKAAVELVGFAKTDRLGAGKDQTLTVSVAKEALKTYDAYGKKTYILEAGDYYLSVGTDAHDALNNILAAKATDEQKARMDAPGNAALTHKVTIGADDFAKYAEAANGNTITNRFDDADLNLYAGTADQHIDYLSRSDWDATYPTAAVSLKCTDETMVRDMQYGHEVEVRDGDELPTYGTVTAPEGTLTIAMLADLKFDDPKWEQLLDQMTFEEQNWMGSYGLHFFAGAKSVAAPGGNSKDGPGGVKTNNPTMGTQFGFPAPVVMAATWDAPLIEDLGVAFAHEALHVKTTLVYAPGSNIHRSAYGGRNWEYYSEDGVLSGKILSAEVGGLQSRGIIVMTKHFAFNDQERNRYGVATFLNEQSAREVYLKPFEIAVTEGKMNGVMTSFNRIGCTWAGAHKGLLTDILRGEWDFLGIVETDSCTGNTYHMGSKYAKAEGLVAGNDMWMSNGSTEYFAEHKNNPTVMLALREACHRILYTQLKSAAMNGVDMNTRLLQITPWWQALLVGLMIAVGVIALACIAMAVLSFVFGSARYAAFRAARAEAKAAAAVEAGAVCASGATGAADGAARNYVRSSRGEDAPVGGSGGAGNGGGKRPRFLTTKRKKIIFAVVSAVVVAAIVLVGVLVPVLSCNMPAEEHVCGHVCPDCGKCLDGECEDPACADKCPGHVVEHVCESTCPVCGGCLNTACEETVCAVKCGAGRTAYAFEAEDAEIVNGTATYQPYRIITSNGRTYVGDLNQNTGATITFTVEAEEAVTASLVVTITRRSIDTVFTDKMGVSVNGGRELVRPVTVPAYKDQWLDSSFADFNLGCVELNKGANTVKFTVLTAGNYSGYNFDKIKLLSEKKIDAAVVEKPHECESKCPVCEKCLDEECAEPVCAEKCAGHDLHEEKALATKAILGKGTGGLPKPETRTPGLMGNLSKNKGATLTFPVNTVTGGKAKLVAAVTSRDKDVKFTDAITVAVNGEDFTTDAVVPTKDGKNDWYNSTEIELGEIELIAGRNDIVFTVATDSDAICFNFHYVLLTRADIEATDPEPDPPVTATTVKLDAVTQARRGAGVIVDKNGDEKITLPEKSSNVIGKLSENKGASLTFEFTAAAAGKAALTAAVTTREADIKFTDAFTVTVGDGEPLVSDAIVATTGKAEWWTPVGVDLGEIDLIKGVNKIVFTVASSDSKNGVNFGYVTLKSETVISAHVCTELCPDCGKCMDAACDDPVCAEKCADKVAVKLLGTDAALGKGTKDLKPEPQRAGLMGEISRNVGAALTYTFNASAGKARLNVAVTTRAKDVKFTDDMTVTVNGGEALVSDAVVPATATDNWYDTVVVDLGEITLVEGENTIVFTVNTGNYGFNFGYMSVVQTGGGSPIDPPVTPAHECESVCPECGKCLDATCTETACAEKCAGHTPVTPAHECESICPECGKCLNATCEETVCAEKCAGHTPVTPAHECESVCPECGKCLNDTCTETACADKCAGHTPVEPTHECESVCPECGKCLDAACTETACADKCAGHTPVETNVKLDAVTQAKRGAGVKGLPNKSGSVVGNISQNKGATLTFEFTAATAGKANLIIAVTTRAKDIKLTDLFGVTVNGGAPLTSDAMIAATGKDDWSNTVEIELGEIDLVMGVNTIVVTVASDDGSIGVNFGYVTLKSETVISAHVCTELCPDCGKCMDAACEDPVCSEKCADKVAVKLLGTDAALGKGTKDLKPEPQRAGLMGEISGNVGATLTYTFNASAGKARLYVAVTTRAKDVKFTDDMTVTVNGGEALVSDAVVPATATDNWYDTVVVDLGEITLVDGENTIVFTVNAGSYGFNFGYMSVVQSV